MSQNSGSLFHLAFLFLIVMDPIGNVPIFVGVLHHFDSEKQKKIILRELFIALGIMILALFFGQGFFHLMNISTPSLEIAGGIILFLLALRMIFATPALEKTGRIPKDPLIVPLAVPAVAGPGILATITLYGGMEGKLTILFAILIAWILMLPILLFSPYLKKFLGENGLVASERLFGYIVVLVAIQMALHGLLTAF